MLVEFQLLPCPAFIISKNEILAIDAMYQQIIWAAHVSHDLRLDCISLVIIPMCNLFYENIGMCHGENYTLSKAAKLGRKCVDLLNEILDGLGTPTTAGRIIVIILFSKIWMLHIFFIISVNPLRGIFLRRNIKRIYICVIPPP